MQLVSDEDGQDGQDLDTTMRVVVKMIRALRLVVVIVLPGFLEVMV